MTLKYIQKARSSFLPNQFSSDYIVYVISNPDLPLRNLKGDYIRISLKRKKEFPFQHSFNFMTVIIMISTLAPLLENSICIIVRDLEKGRD